MNQLDALREHALYMNDGRFNKLMTDSARKALNQSSFDTLQLAVDVAFAPASHATRLTYFNLDLDRTISLADVISAALLTTFVSARMP